jgi:membrane-bound lytic murein transglycosylase D
MENFAWLRPKIAPIYAQFGLPEALLFGMAAKESLGRAHSYSPAGAVGLLQFMPATAMRYGLRMQDRMDLRLDAEAATRANAQYINDQLALLNGDLSLVLAAYNSGEGRLGRLHQRYPNATFWDAEIRNALPAETQDFVPMVLAASWLYLNPDQFGLPRFDTSHATLSLKRPSSLGELTICLGAAAGNPDGWFRTLRNLNPRVKPGDALPPGTALEVPGVLIAAYAERCVDTPITVQAAALFAANYPPVGSQQAYTVQRGDTLAAIVRRTPCTSLKQLAELNELKAPSYALTPGQTLQLPRCG